jgi:hypothetical protein
MTYEVVTFKSDTNGALARIRMPMQGAKGKTITDWLPVAIHAPTEGEAADKAHAFYRAEQIRLSSKAENVAAGRLKAAATRKEKAA